MYLAASARQVQEGQEQQQVAWAVTFPVHSAVAVHIQQTRVLCPCVPLPVGFTAPGNMSVTVKDVEAAYMPLQDLTSEVTYETTVTLSFYAEATAVVWLLASLQLLATCILSYPRLPSSVGAAMCCAGGVAAVCGVLASVIQLSHSRQTGVEDGE